MIVLMNLELKCTKRKLFQSEVNNREIIAAIEENNETKINRKIPAEKILMIGYF